MCPPKPTPAPRPQIGILVVLALYLSEQPPSNHWSRLRQKSQLVSAVLIWLICVATLIDIVHGVNYVQQGRRMRSARGEFIQMKKESIGRTEHMRTPPFCLAIVGFYLPGLVVQLLVLVLFLFCSVAQVRVWVDDDYSMYKVVVGGLALQVINELDNDVVQHVFCELDRQLDEWDRLRRGFQRSDDVDDVH